MCESHLQCRLRLLEKLIWHNLSGFKHRSDSKRWSDSQVSIVMEEEG